MKMSICSDIHLEFGEFRLIDAPPADVMVLAGDIIVAFDLTYLNNIPSSTASGLERAKRYFNFITKCCRLYKHVIFLMGNHEHYRGEFNSTIHIIKETFAHIENFHLLENETIEIDGTVFLGSTLWTSMNEEDSQTIDAISENLNDYQRIMFEDEIGVRDLDVDDVLSVHRKSMTFLKKSVRKYENQKLIVVTHHAPSKLSLHPKIDSSDLLNGAYSSDLDSFIGKHPQIKFWIHGHTHKRQNYMIGNTNVVCNPRGYLGVEPMAMQFEWLVIEV